MVLGFSVSSALGGMPLFGPAVVPVRVLADSYGYFMRPGLPWQAIPIVSGRVTPKALRKASKGVSQVSLRLGWGSVRTRSELRESKNFVDAAHRSRRALLLVSFVALVPMGVESLAPSMLFAMLGVAGDTLTVSNFALLGPKTINELIFPGFCPSRVWLVKWARGHNAPSLERSFFDGASEFHPPGWPFSSLSAHAQGLEVQNSNVVVSIWTTEPTGIELVNCCSGLIPKVSEANGATGIQLLQFRASIFWYNSQIHEFSTSSNGTICFERVKPNQCNHGFVWHQMQETDRLPFVHASSTSNSYEILPFPGF